MPVILWQVWAFVAPGLTDSEKRTVRPWIPLALLFFALGVALAYIVLPFAMGFLLGFTDDQLVGNLAAGPYFDFVTTMFLAFGLIMEFPIVLYGLSRVGIVTSQRLVASRRMAVLGHRDLRRGHHARHGPRQPVRPRRDHVPALRGHDLLHPPQRQVRRGEVP